MSFDNLGLIDQLLTALDECGYTTPTQIQEKTIPHILQEKDILGGAQTGTGKTASFTLPLLQRVKEKKKENGKAKLTALVLVPTRELAAQVHESILTYGKHLRLRSTVVFGGVSIKSQIMKIRKGVDILVATPGRLLDHVNQKTINLSSIEMLVLDEADCMLDMGFIHDIRKILGAVPENRQTLLFSATFSDGIRDLAEKFLKDPVTIQVAGKNAVADQVKQIVYPVDRVRKEELLLDLIQKNDWKQVLVFTRTKHGANNLCESLEKAGIRSAAIHGNKTQAARMKALSNFKKGYARVLVGTDIAARGLNIDQLPHVVNFELPIVASDYVHRIGRTGRAGNEGEAISLVCIDEHGLLRDIERLIKRSIPQEVLEGYEVDASIKPIPIRKGKGSSGGRRKPPMFKGSRSPKETSFRRQRDGDSKKRSEKERRPRKHSAPAQKESFEFSSEGMRKKPGVREQGRWKSPFNKVRKKAGKKQDTPKSAVPFERKKARPPKKYK